jgi:hypothetical protein
VSSRPTSDEDEPAWRDRKLCENGTFEFFGQTGGTRDIEGVTGTGHWYRIGEGLVEVRWVYVHDGTGTHRDEYFLTTDITMKPQQIVEWYTQRWAIETTFQECREYLKLESTKGYCQATVLRLTPCLFGL